MGKYDKTDYVNENGNKVNVRDIERLDRYSDGKSTVITHNTLDGRIPLFDKADVIFSQLSGDGGYEKHMKDKIGVEENAFVQYMESISDLVKSISVPAFLIGHKANIRELNTEGYFELEIEEYDRQGYCILLNGAEIDESSTTTMTDVLDFVADNYNFAFDPCGGNGDLARAMNERNKPFISSDINAKCTNFVASTVLEK